MDRELNIPEGYPFSGKKLVEVISNASLQSRIKIIGQEISSHYKNKLPIIIGVLNGAFLFMADLVRNLNIHYEIDFIKISSYGSNTKTSGTVRLLKDISADITDRHVLIVEDIVDTGISLNFLKHRMEEANPKSLKFVTCLYKYEVAKVDFDLD